MTIELGEWYPSWARSGGLIVLTAILHTAGLGLIGEYVVTACHRFIGQRHRMLVFVVVVAVSVLLITFLHAFEAGIWAIMYLDIKGFSSWNIAMLYSLEAMTGYGHVPVDLPDHWRLMGAIEALNGMMLLGLTTASLMAIVQRAWPLGDHQRR
jgi:hypothetical protein